MLPGQRSVVLLSLLSVGLPTASAAAQRLDDAPRVQVGAAIELEGAGRPGADGAQKLEMLVGPELTVQVRPRLRVVGSVRIRGDALDVLEPGSPPQSAVAPLSRRLTIGDRVEAELRELYVVSAVGGASVSVGKQQIVWGQADGLKVLDVVNPQDFREFILDDFDQSRIPLWAVAAEAAFGEGPRVQLVWLPDRTYHRFPPPGAAFDLTAAVLEPLRARGLAVDLGQAERPRRFVADSDVGGRVSVFARGWDLAVHYLFHYDDRPVLLPQPPVRTDAPRVTLTPRYARAHLGGASAANAFGSLAVRGEMAVRTFGAIGGAASRAGGTEVDWLVGVDWSAIAETLVSLQVYQNYRPHGDAPAPIPLQRGTVLTLFLRRQWLNDALAAETGWLHSATDNDGLLRPKLTYELHDNVLVWAGGDLFYGTARGMFGQFAGRDRLTAGLALRL